MEDVLNKDDVKPPSHVWHVGCNYGGTEWKCGLLGERVKWPSPLVLDKETKEPLFHTVGDRLVKGNSRASTPNVLLVRGVALGRINPRGSKEEWCPSSGKLLELVRHWARKRWTVVAYVQRKEKLQEQLRDFFARVSQDGGWFPVCSCAVDDCPRGTHNKGEVFTNIADLDKGLVTCKKKLAGKDNLWCKHVGDLLLNRIATHWLQCQIDTHSDYVAAILRNEELKKLKRCNDKTESETELTKVTKPGTDDLIIVGSATMPPGPPGIANPHADGEANPGLEAEQGASGAAATPERVGSQVPLAMPNTLASDALASGQIGGDLLGEQAMPALPLSINSVANAAVAKHRVDGAAVAHDVELDVLGRDSLDNEGCIGNQGGRWRQGA